MGAQRAAAPAARRAEAAPEPWADDAQLASARAGVADLLADIERARAGLVRHRALVIGDRSGAVAQALCERFDECDAVSERLEEVRAASRANRHGGRCRFFPLAERAALPFADETFDLVHCRCQPARPEAGGSGSRIREMLRVLRLHGVGVAEFHRSHADGGTCIGALSTRALPARLSALDGVLLRAGERFEIAVTVANAGASILGSSVQPLLLESAWIHRPDCEPDEKLLDGTLFPQSSLTASIPLSVPAVAGEHALELCVVSRGPWGERRSSSMLLMIDVAPSTRARERVVMARVRRCSDEQVELAIARGGGVLLDASDCATAEAEGVGRRYVFARA